MSKTMLVIGCCALLGGCSDDDDKNPGPDVGTPDLPLPSPEGGVPDGPAAPDGSVVNFQTEVQSIFTQSCASSACHAGAAPKAGLSLEDGKSISNLVGVGSVQCSSLKRVEAGAPDKSYLVQKLEGQGSCFTMNRMPPGGPLGQAEIALAQAWIAAGALP